MQTGIVTKIDREMADMALQIESIDDSAKVSGPTLSNALSKQRQG